MCVLLVIYINGVFVLDFCPHLDCFFCRCAIEGHRKQAYSVQKRKARPFKVRKVLTDMPIDLLDLEGVG